MVEAAREIPPIPTHQEVTLDVLGRFQNLGARYWGWVTVLSFLFVLGILGFVIRLTGGFDDRSIWGYHVATMSFIVTTFLAMPLISAGLRLTKAHWRRPLTRVTENMSITGLLVVLMLLPALAALPPLGGRRNIWFDFPLGAPGSKKLADFLISAKVTPHERDRVAVLCDQLGPIWVIGHRIDDRVKLTELTRRVLHLRAPPLQP